MPLSCLILICMSYACVQLSCLILICMHAAKLKHTTMTYIVMYSYACSRMCGHNQDPYACSYMHTHGIYDYIIIIGGIPTSCMYGHSMSYVTCMYGYSMSYVACMYGYSMSYVACMYGYSMSYVACKLHTRLSLIFFCLDPHNTEQIPGNLMFRIDAHLYFANVKYLEDRLDKLRKREVWGWGQLWGPDWVPGCK